jgi:hypothetical protein
LFRGSNAISGREGRLYMDGEEIAYAKNFEATIEKQKGDVPIIGRRFMSKKTSGVSGTGTITLYKVTSKFNAMMMEYVRTGRDAYFTIQGVLDDQGSDRGTERVTLYDCNIDSVRIGNLDAEADALEEEIPFTFEGADLPEELKGGF